MTRLRDFRHFIFHWKGHFFTAVLKMCRYIAHFAGLCLPRLHPGLNILVSSPSMPTFVSSTSVFVLSFSNLVSLCDPLSDCLTLLLLSCVLDVIFHLLCFILCVSVCVLPSPPQTDLQVYFSGLVCFLKPWR